VTTQYLYDAFGRRVKKISGTTTTFYLWDNENLIAEYSAAGQRTKRYAYIPNRHAALQIEDANGIYNVHTNHLDTPTQLTDSTQKIVWQANYQAFGNTQINQDPDANGKTIIYNQRFPGQYADTETGLYYNFYRDYDPSTGRYLQSDPIGLNGGINLYGYVQGNPLNWFDLFGLASTIPDPNGIIPGGPWTPASGQLPGDFQGPPKPGGGPRDLCRYVPDENNGGTPGAREPYWKTKSSEGGWQRFNGNGSPISPAQAHGHNGEKLGANPFKSGGGGLGGGPIKPPINPVKPMPGGGGPKLPPTKRGGGDINM